MFYCVQKPKLCPILFVQSVVIFRGRYSLVLGLGASPAQRHLFAERLSKPEALWLFTEFVNIVTVKCVLEIFKAFIAGPHHNSQGPAFRDLPALASPHIFLLTADSVSKGVARTPPISQGGYGRGDIGILLIEENLLWQWWHWKTSNGWKFFHDKIVVL